MRSSPRSWIAVAVAVVMTGCGGVHNVTPASSRDGAVSKRAAMHPHTGSTPTPCRVRDNTAIWKLKFHYTGGSQTFVVPPGVKQITVVAQGAQGGNALGGCERATIAVKPGETLGIFVGGQGFANGRGGYNGGGDGGKGCCGGNPGGGGGGATDLRQGGTTLASRVVVAGGGGGSSGSGFSGGDGGGPTGDNGTSESKAGQGWGYGGTQTAGGKGTGGKDGTLGNGGNGGSFSTGTFGGGGGGGGYYGGGGGRWSDHQGSGIDNADGGGGGGSGFASSKSINVMTVNGQRYGDGNLVIAWPQSTTQFQSGLSKPLGIALDKSDNVYVTTTNSYVRMYAQNGTMTRVGQNFPDPAAVAVDKQGNVYVSDLSDQRIYKVAPPFGNSTNGTRTVAVDQVKAAAMSFDGNGNLYFSDVCGDNCGVIKKLAPNGTVSTFASKNVYTVTSLAVNASCTSNCVVLDTELYNGVFGKEYFYFNSFDAKANETALQGGDYPLPDPTAIATDASGNVDVVDNVLKTVVQVQLQGTVTGPDVQLGNNWSTPQGVAVNPWCKYACPVYVTDYENGWIVEVR